MKYLIFSLLLLFGCNKKASTVVQESYPIQSWAYDTSLVFSGSTDLIDTIPAFYETLISIPESSYEYMYEIKSAKNDTVSVLCEERGHVIYGGMITLMNPSTRIVDTDSTRIMIYTNNNFERGYCWVCHEYIEKPVQEHPDTTVLWKKE